MRKSMIAAVGLSLFLVGCGETNETMSTNDVEVKNQDATEKTKLDREEKIASEFYSHFISGDEEQRQKFLDEYVHSEEKDYFKEMVSSLDGVDDRQNTKVIESSVVTSDDGTEAKAVLLNVENIEGDLREVILIFDKEEQDLKLVYSITSENEGENAEIFNELRENFNAPIAEKLVKRQEKEAAQQANIEVADQMVHSWKDSIGTIWSNYSGEIKNTGDAIAELGSIQVNFVDDNGSILGTSDMITPVPNILSPGETAFIGETTMLNAVDNADQIADATINIDFNKTTDTAMLLETENVNFKEIKNDYASPYVVTGTVKNMNNELVDDIRLAAGLYDSEGKLVGVLEEILQVSLNHDNTAGFEMSYPDLSKDIKGQVTEVKVKAFNWSWSF